MRIDRLRLRDFRNIAELELQPGGHVNIIHGDNAQGKTNLIEAVWLLTGAKSFRGGRDADLVRFGAACASVEAAFFRDGREQTADLAFGAGVKKRARLNEIPLPSGAGLAGVFCAVVFSPAHLSLAQDGPSERRRFADGCICQLSPRYIALLSDYSRTLLQRNTLLKDIAYAPSLLDTLDVWDERLAELGALICRNRAEYVARLAALAGEIYAGISAGRERFGARYVPGGAPEGLARGEYRAWLLEALRMARADDLRAGATSVGPHRDDIELSVDGLSLRGFGSQGQQRSAVLALKLAESRLAEQMLGERPVILLDDVMSELDGGRRDYLLNHLDGSQVFITCCDRQSFDSLQGGREFELKAGALCPA